MKQAAGKIIGAALFAAGVAAVWLWPKPKAEVAEVDVVRPVLSMVVAERATIPELRCPGRVRAGESRDMMFEVPGRLVEFKVNKEASYRMVESDDQTQPYLRYRNVIINNIDYDFADYTSSVGSKFYYNISGTLTLQRTINTQIPDEDQAIQW